MKKIMILLIMCVFLTACGTKQTSDEVGMGNSSEERMEQEQGPQQLDVEATIFAADLEEAGSLMNTFIDEKLQADEYGGFYLDQEDDRPLVLQLTEEADVNDVVERLEQFSNEYVEEETTKTKRVQFERVTYSYPFLVQAQNDLYDLRERFFTGEHPIWGTFVDVWTNKVVLDVSLISDLNLEEMESHFGTLDFLEIHEGPLAEMTDDEPPVPASPPYESGQIKEIKNETETILIEDQIYVSTRNAIIVDEEGEIPFSELKLDDYVHVWIEGGVNDSSPQQGGAIFIQKKEK